MAKQVWGGKMDEVIKTIERNVGLIKLNKSAGAAQCRTAQNADPALHLRMA
jgi:hypothetical protein